MGNAHNIDSIHQKKSSLSLTQAVSPFEYVSLDILFCNRTGNIERVYISNRDKSRNEKKNMPLYLTIL